MSITLAGSIKNYLEENWDKFKSSISDISKSDDGKFFVDSKREGWVFDKISDAFFPKKQAYSADGIFLKGNRICFVEFKSGFEKLVNESNFDPSKIICPKIAGNPCSEYGKVLKDRDRFKSEKLQENIQLKAVESFCTFKNKILNEVNKQQSADLRYNLVFYAVLDGKTSDNEIYQKVCADLGGVDVTEVNYFSKMESCLKRFRDPNFWYDEVKVLTISDFKTFIES